MRPPSAPDLERGTSLWHDAWRRLARNRAAVASLAVLALIALACLVGPLVPGLPDPNRLDLPNKNLGPAPAHWFGTDHLGRDIFARILFGGRVSLAVGLITTTVAVTIGITWGAVAGYAGGRLDAAMMRVVDTLYALPFLIVVILLGAALQPLTGRLTELSVALFAGPDPPPARVIAVRTAVEPITTLVPLFIAIGALSWLNLARIVRAQVQTVAASEFVEAARSLGLGRTRILFRHILPNVLGPVVVYTTLTIPGVMLFEAVLSFLGLGVRPPNSSWGILIEEGANRMLSNIWLLLFPALFFSATLFALNFLGDGLRDALDPRAADD